MIDASAGVPPHIALLLNEQFDFSDLRSAMRKLKGMTRELKNQSASTVLKPEVDRFNGFRAVLSGGLDLFSSQGACQGTSCRIGYASQIARSIALMADQVVVGDALFGAVNSLKSRPTNDDLRPLFVDLMVLKVIQPLIEAGIVRFSTPFHYICAGCAKPFDERIDQLTDRILRDVSSSLKVDRGENPPTIDLTPIYTPGILVCLDDDLVEGVSDEQI